MNTEKYTELCSMLYLHAIKLEECFSVDMDSIEMDAYSKICALYCEAFEHNPILHVIDSEFIIKLLNSQTIDNVIDFSADIIASIKINMKPLIKKLCHQLKTELNYSMGISK